MQLRRVFHLAYCGSSLQHSLYDFYVLFNFFLVSVTRGCPTHDNLCRCSQPNALLVQLWIFPLLAHEIIFYFIPFYFLIVLIQMGNTTPRSVGRGLERKKKKRSSPLLTAASGPTQLPPSMSLVQPKSYLTGAHPRSPLPSSLFFFSSLFIPPLLSSSSTSFPLPNCQFTLTFGQLYLFPVTASAQRFYVTSASPTRVAAAKSSSTSFQ